MPACPPLHVLEDAAAGKASVGSDISAHVTRCMNCRRTLEDIRQNNALLTQITALSRSFRPQRERPHVPPLVDDYEILDRVAQGGQGIVYRAIQKRTKRCVALKLLLGGHFATSRQRSRFDREVELAAGLHHPNIVTVHDSGITPDGRPFLSMELIEGRPLDQWAKSCRSECTGTETIRRLLGVIIKVCSALSYAHLRGVLHRDLKPANILVDANDEPHIVDFGLARPVNDETIIATMTGEFTGTIAYAAPEQVSIGENHADARSDVYALGVLLYEVLTGRLPYLVTGAIAEIVRQITTTEPPAPSRMNSSIPVDLDTITSKAMTKDLNRRYQSARDLGEDLRRFLANEPIIARSDSTWYVLRKVAHRHRRTLIAGAAAGLAFLMCVVAVTVYIVFDARATAAKVRAAAETERAEATSLVLHSASRSRSKRDDPTRYGSRDLDRLNEQLRFGWLAGNPERESAAAFLMSAIYRKGDSPWGAEDLIRQANMRRAFEADPDPADISHGFSDLAEVLLTRHRLSEAAQYGEWALAVDKEAGGEKCLDVARDMELLARIHLAQGDNASALKLATSAADIQAEKLGEDHVDFANSLDTRAAAWLAAGDIQAAEKDCLRSLRLRFTLLQDEDPAVARSLFRLAAIRDRHPGPAQDKALANVFSATKASEIADKLRELATDIERLNGLKNGEQVSPVITLRRILSVKEAILGTEEKGLLSTLASLVVEAHDRNDKPEELSMLIRASQIIERVHGPRSLAYANCLEEQAYLLQDLNRYLEAIVTMKRSVEIWRALPVQERDEFKAAVNERSLAYFMAYEGQYEEAAEHFAHCGEVIDRLHGPEHPIMPNVRAGRAWALMRLGRTEGAEREARESLALANRLGLTMDSGQRSFVTYCAGSILTELGKLDEGLALLTSVWEGDRYNLPIRPRPVSDRYRQCLVRDMIKNCAARNDAGGEARWRKELPEGRG